MKVEYMIFDGYRFICIIVSGNNKVYKINKEDIRNYTYLNAWVDKGGIMHLGEKGGGLEQRRRLNKTVKRIKLYQYKEFLKYYSGKICDLRNNADMFKSYIDNFIKNY